MEEEICIFSEPILVLFMLVLLKAALDDVAVLFSEPLLLLLSFIFNNAGLGYVSTVLPNEVYPKSYKLQ